MKERDQDSDPYWQEDVAIGEGRVQRSDHLIRMQVHMSDERYRDHRELIPLDSPNGVRTYFHTKPYILVPDIILTIGLYPRSKGNEVGEVVSSQWDGMKHQEIGNAQAWFYQREKTLMLWECLLHGWCHKENPVEDQLLKTVWSGFERFLVQKLNGVERIVTPGWEPTYEQTRWQEFLRQQGYRRFNKQAFLKKVAPVGAGDAVSS